MLQHTDMKQLFLLNRTYLRINSFMPVAGDGHHIGPVGRCHDYSGNLGAGDVERRGTVLIRALDARTAVLIGTLAMAEHTLL